MWVPKNMPVATLATATIRGTIPLGLIAVLATNGSPTKSMVLDVGFDRFSKYERPAFRLKILANGGIASCVAWLVENPYA